MTAPVRTRLLRATARLTYRDGVAAASVEAIVAEAGVARRSLYRHFPGGKDQLVAAALQARDDVTVDALLVAATERASDAADPRAVVVAVFDVLDAEMSRPAWRGCPFLRAATELPNGHPAREVAMAHRRRLRHRLAALLRDAGADDDRAADVAGLLLLLVDGALAASLLRPQDRPARQARRLAADLLAHLPGREIAADPSAISDGSAGDRR